MTKILETERLILRAWTFDDEAELFAICSDAAVMRYIGTGKPYENLKQANEFLRWAVNYQNENGFCRWAILLKENFEIVGSCGFARPHGTQEVELGYLLARKFWGKGLATEAAQACLDYGFVKLDFREIIALTNLENIASQRVLNKIGFVRRGIEMFDGEESLVYLKKKNSENSK